MLIFKQKTRYLDHKSVGADLLLRMHRKKERHEQATK